MTWTRVLLSMSLMACAAPVEKAQEFEAVAIKPYAPAGALREACNAHGDPGLLYYVGCTLAQLVRMAYDLKEYQMVSKGPAWVETDAYVIQARASKAASRAEMQRMLQNALSARFHLVSHWEDREAAAFLLEAGSHGLKLPAAVKTDRCGEIAVRETLLRSDCLTMDDIAEQLQAMLEKPVANRTSAPKENRYQFHVEWNKDEEAADVLPALIQEFGLVLKPGKAPLRTLVLDSAERPDAN